MVWEVSRYIMTKKDTLVGPSVLLDTVDLDTHYITKSPRQGLHIGMVVDHQLAEVESHTGISMLLWKKGSSASYAPGSQFGSLIGHQKCDSGEPHHWPRYTGDLPAT